MGRGSLKNKPSAEKAPIWEVPNPVCLEEVLDLWVHVPKDEHLKEYVEQV